MAAAVVPAAEATASKEDTGRVLESPDTNSREEQFTICPLSEEECKPFYLNAESHCTVTFYKGSFDIEKIKGRLLEICRANPWVLGRIKWSDKIRFKSKKRGLDLIYMDSPPDDFILKRCTNILPPDSYNISDNIHYSILSKNILNSPCNVVRGKELIENSESPPFFKVSFIPFGDNKKFAMVVAMSKLAGDGFSYYSIMNQMGIKNKIEAMEIERKQYKNYLISALGMQEYEMYFSLGKRFNFWLHKKFRKKPIVRCYNLEDSRLDRLKNKAHYEYDEPFISTNDIVTSHFAKLVKPRLLSIMLDFRLRMPDIVYSDVGNYQFEFYYQKEDFKTPALIRRSLMGERREGQFIRMGANPGRERSLPYFTRPFCRMAFVNNWTSFTEGDFKLHEDYEQTMHLPIIDTEDIRRETCIIFRTKHKQDAALVISRVLNDKKLAKDSSGGGPFGFIASVPLFRTLKK